MILQSLFRRYENLANEGKLPLRGWSNEKISFGIRLNENGEIVGVLDLRNEVTKGKKKVLEPKIIKVIGSLAHTNKIESNFISDNSSYILGIDNKKDFQRNLRCFDAAKEKHLKLLENCNSKTATSIKNFFKKWDPTNIEEQEVLKPYLKEISGSNLIFIFDNKYAIEEDDIKNTWQSTLNNSNNDKKMQCLVTGKFETIVKTHRKIKGIKNMDNDGALVSFNKGNQAFESYGKRDDQGLNAPVSEYAAFAYTTALNNLLADKNRVQHFGDDTTVVYWAEKSAEEYQDAFDFFTFGDDEKSMDDKTLNAAMEAIKNGNPIDYENTKLDTKTPFYILGLSPNVARISIRFFLISTFGEVLKNVINHHKNMEIVSSNNNKYIPLWKLKDSLVASKSRDKTLSPVLAGAVLKSILSGSFYPESLFANAMMRIRSEQDSKKDDTGPKNYKISFARCAIIKAYLIRNKGREITVALNENERDIAYILGRIFSVLEKIQKDSVDGEINATIKDKYFNSFCATPQKIFSVLNKLSQYHLKKIEGGKKVYYEKMLGELMTKIDPGNIPKILPLEEQGMFVLGYYHQTQKLYSKKEDNKDE